MERESEIYLAKLPQFKWPRSLLATDGSFNEATSFIAWAAVSGAGDAMFGGRVSECPGSHIAEMSAVRYGLRAYEDGEAVHVRTDDEGVAEILRLLSSHPANAASPRFTGPDSFWLKTTEARETLRDVHQHAQRLVLVVEHVVKPQKNSKILPEDRFIRAAHRLAWATQRCHSLGIPLRDQDVRERLTGFFPNSTARRHASLRRDFDDRFADYL